MPSFLVIKIIFKTMICIFTKVKKILMNMNYKNKPLPFKSIIKKINLFGALMITLFISNQIDAQTNYPEINSEIKNGNFNHAKELIKSKAYQQKI